jgi:hypothetical protein
MVWIRHEPTSAGCQRQRGLEAVGWHVDLGPGVEQEPGHLHMAVHGGLHERRVHLVRLVLLEVDVMSSSVLSGIFSS